MAADGAQEYSEGTAERIDAEMPQLLEAAHVRVRETLTAKRGVLEALAKLLMEREVVDRQALTQLLAVQQPAELPAGAA